MNSPVKYLVTGASSGLGGSVLATLYKNISDPSQIAAASSRLETGQRLQQDYPGIQFRRLDYNDPKSLVESLAGVERFFFVSSPEVNTEKRNKQHERVVKASVEAKVGHVCHLQLWIIILSLCANRFSMLGILLQSCIWGLWFRIQGFRPTSPPGD